MGKELSRFGFMVIGGAMVAGVIAFANVPSERAIENIVTDRDQPAIIDRDQLVIIDKHSNLHGALEALNNVYNCMAMWNGDLAIPSAAFVCLQNVSRQYLELSGVRIDRETIAYGDADLCPPEDAGKLGCVIDMAKIR